MEYIINVEEAGSLGVTRQERGYTSIDEVYARVDRLEELGCTAYVWGFDCDGQIEQVL